MPFTTTPEPKARIIALDQRCDVPVFINCREVSGIAGGGMAGAWIAIGFFRIDFCGALFRVALVQQTGHRNVRRSADRRYNDRGLHRRASWPQFSCGALSRLSGRP